MSKRPTGFFSGDWLIICDVCGFTVMASETRHKWDGAVACHQCWEPRHPQELLRHRKDRITPPFIRPEPEGTYGYVPFDIDAYPPPAPTCSRTARVGYAIVGCAVAGTI